MSTASPELRSLVVSEEKGLPLFFRVLVPPNIAGVSERDKIMIKVEAVVRDEIIPPEKLDRGRAYKLEPAHFLVAMLLESWCDGELHGLLSLSRDNLRALLTPPEGDLAVYFANKPTQPLEWREGKVVGVHEHLTVKKETEDRRLKTEGEGPKETTAMEEKDTQVHDTGTPMVVEG